MVLMRDQFAERPIAPADITYPVLVTTYDDASVEINSLNFAVLSYKGNDMAQRLQYMKESNILCVTHQIPHRTVYFHLIPGILPKR